jgi:hypothetical protein
MGLIYLGATISYHVVFWQKRQKEIGSSSVFLFLSFELQISVFSFNNLSRSESLFHHELYTNNLLMSISVEPLTWIPFDLSRLNL